MQTLPAHGKISNTLKNLAPNSSLREWLLSGKKKLHESKVQNSAANLAGAKIAFADARDCFVEVGDYRPDLRALLCARLERFVNRFPNIATAAPSDEFVHFAGSQPLAPKRLLKEKGPEMWSSRILLKQNAAALSPYYIEASGHAFVVNPKVFSPAVFPDTFFFAASIPVKRGERFLEIGSGTGMVAALAAIRGASYVVATDINPDAVANTIENFALHNLSSCTDVRLGDVFTPIEPNETFDTIWWNVPFMHCDNTALSRLEMALYDPGYEALERYLSGAQQHLTVGGHVLIGFSTTHGHMDVLEALAARYGWSLRLLAEHRVEFPPSEQGAPRIAVQLFEAVLRTPNV